MAEPEGLLIEGARIAAVAARDLWHRLSPRAGPPTLPLARVRQRLALLGIAIYGQAFPGDASAVVAAEPPPAPTWLARLARALGGAEPPRSDEAAEAVLPRAPRTIASPWGLAIRFRWRTAERLADPAALPSTDGVRLRLPPALDARYGEAAALATYRLLLLGQAARAARGSPGCLPVTRRDRLGRDLYLLSEAAAVDRALAASLPGLRTDLRAARAAALADRPGLDRLSPLERAVESLLREVLAEDPASPSAPVPTAAVPADSLAWALATAARLRAAEAGRYRGLPVVAFWGRLTMPPPVGGDGQPAEADPDALRPPAGRIATLRRRPQVRTPKAGEDDERPGTWMIRPDEPMESVEDPMGLQRPADRDGAADPEDLADSLAELPEARIVRTPGTPREVLAGDDPPPRRPAGALTTRPTGVGIVYPEWDCAARAYRPRGAIVRPAVAPAGDGAWVARTLERHRRLVRQVRRRFEGLRPRRVWFDRQADGPELDLTAYVTAFADRRAGRAADDRLYAAVRPARREAAIALLVDVSASTDAWVAGPRRIIDVEKEALLVLAEALDALGDRHAILAFSGEGPEAVRLLMVKGFDERSGPEVRRRIAALEPDRYTRSGAAIRHASALLARETARHRLLLLLSDGRPNDVDRYEGRYGVEDTRQAVAEARLSGLHLFCVTVDREAPAYLPSVFGRGAYAVLRQPERLPTVLVDVVRRMLVG